MAIMVMMMSGGDGHRERPLPDAYAQSPYLHCGFHTTYIITIVLLILLMLYYVILLILHYYTYTTLYFNVTYTLPDADAQS